MTQVSGNYMTLIQEHIGDILYRGSACRRRPGGERVYAKLGVEKGVEKIKMVIMAGESMNAGTLSCKDPEADRHRRKNGQEKRHNAVPLAKYCAPNVQKQDISTAPCRSQSSTQEPPLPPILLSLFPADVLGAGVAKGGCLGRGVRIHDELALRLERPHSHKGSLS